jgi:hypothetical protein
MHNYAKGIIFNTYNFNIYGCPFTGKMKEITTLILVTAWNIGEPSIQQGHHILKTPFILL